MAEVQSLQAQLDESRALATRQRIESEAALHELQSQLNHAEQSLNEERLKASLVGQGSEKDKKRIKELEAEKLSGGEEREKEKKEVEDARRKVAEAEKEKRELLSVVQREEEEKNALEESLSALRKLHTSLSSSHSALESSLQESTTSARTSVLRIQTLTSTITSLEADKQFLTTELNRGREEWSSSRRESHQTLIRVQSELEQTSIELREVKTSSSALKTAHESLSKRFEQTLEELAKVREERDANEGNFGSEMTAMRRLVEILEKREEERKKRLEEIERDVEEERRAALEKEEELNEVIRRERERSDELEVKCAELREAVEAAASGAGGGGDDSMMLNGRGRASSTASDSFALSPSAMLAVKGQKSGRSYAEIYGEYIRMQDELARERAETKRLGECLSQILSDIEERAPLLKEQRQEYDRLSIEATEIAAQLAQAISDRESSDRKAEGFRLDLDLLTRKHEIQTQQLQDLGRQVRSLSRQLASSELSHLSSESPDDFEEEEAEIARRATVESTTDAVVSAHLVTFKTINELQLQNQKLLRITRELGQQMERGEGEVIERRRGEENAAVEEAHELILKLKDEVESGRMKVETVGRERDMLRRMLNQRGGGGGSAGTSASGAGEGMADVESARLLVEVQTTFEAYKTEIAVDLNRLKEDLDRAQKEANMSRSELAKSKAQAEFLAERFRLLTETHTLQTDEVKQMAKRASDLQQNMAKQDSASHKLNEENHELRSQNNQLRHENTNFKSEREVWKSVEGRLIEENSALSKERAHLADLMRNLQTMQNELERSGSEARKRLEDQVARLDSQNMEIKEKLNQETDASRQLALRKELEAKTYQERLDKLTSEHQETREALVVAKTSQEHLEQRVNDLVLQVTAREEKLSVYEGRGTSNGEVDPTRSHEEQLEISLADLRNELREAKSELERAKEHVEQYKAIAEAQGESLREINSTYDEYKASTDGAIAEKEVEITGLRERLHVLTTDLTAASTQNSELHRQIETSRTTFEKERKVLEDEMVNLRAADQAVQQAQLSAQEDLRRQAQLARDAHEKYDRELVAHADDVRRLSEIKEELEVVRATVRDHQTAAEVAVANLATSESSWTRQRTTFEQEIADLRKRSSDLDRQNTVLHTQLETFGAQAALLQSRLANAEAVDGSEGAVASAESVGAITSSLNSTVEQLREVIRYMRKEKEIVDLQLDFSKQEATRLRQQLDFATRSLEETRQALTEERQKSGDSSTSSAQHAELLERIHTAKLLRESNQTLRDENEANLRKAAQLEAQLQHAIGELDPLKEKVLTLQAELDARQQNIKLLQEDNERWKVRNQSILAKYERIDPEELQILKDEVESLRVVKESVDSVQAQLAEANTNLDAEKVARNAVQERFKSIQVQARSMRETHQKELATLREQVAAGQTSSAEATNAVSEQLRLEKEQLTAQIATATQEKTASETRLQQEINSYVEKVTALEASLAEQAVALAKAQGEAEWRAKREKPIFEKNKELLGVVKTHDAQIQQLRQDFATNNAEEIQKAVDARIALLPNSSEISDSAAAITDAVNKKTAELAAERETAVATAVAEATSQLRADLAKAQEQAANASSSTSSDPLSGGEEVEKLRAELETAKKALDTQLEEVKARLSEEAKGKEKEITDKLEAEIAKLKADAAASSSTPSTVDVDAIVQAKLAELDATRSAAQQKAIDDAVQAAMAKQRTEHEAALTASIAKTEQQAALKNQLLVKSNANLKAQLTAMKAAAAPAPESAAPVASTSTAPPSSEATTSTLPLPPLTSTIPTPTNANGAAARGGRGRGAGARGGRGRGGDAPAGAANAAPAARGRGTPATRGTPTLSLRGAAAGGGVLGAILSTTIAANDKTGAPKRAREEDAAAGDLAKRLKPGPPPPNGEGST